MARELTTINTGCTIVEEKPGVKSPGIKICPIETQIAVLNIKTVGHNPIDPDEGPEFITVEVQWYEF